MVGETNKNLHATVPSALLETALQTATSEGITLDELILDAVKRRVEMQGNKMDEILAFGKRQAKAMGTRPRDVQRAIDQVRAEDSSPVQ